MMLITIVNTIAILVGIYIVLDMVMAAGEGWMLGIILNRTDSDEVYDWYLNFDIYADDHKWTYMGIRSKVISFMTEAGNYFMERFY